MVEEKIVTELKKKRNIRLFNNTMKADCVHIFIHSSYFSADLRSIFHLINLLSQCFDTQHARNKQQKVKEPQTYYPQSAKYV